MRIAPAVFFGCILLICLSFLSEAISGETESQAGNKEVIQIGHLTIDKKRREIRLKVRLAIEEGILEYLLVDDHGKTYESVFKMDAPPPSQLNFALLLIGCQPLPFPDFQKLLDTHPAVDKLKAEHPMSLVSIELRQKGRPLPLSTLVRNRADSLKPLVWVHTGGMFLKDNRYAGDINLSHIGIWPDPSAVINLFSKAQNPYRGDFGFEMNTLNNLVVDDTYELLLKRVMDQ